MSGIQTKITGHAKGWVNAVHDEKKNQPLETDSELTQ